MADVELADARLGPLVADLRGGHATPAAVVDRYRGRVEQADDEIRAFLPEPDRQSRLDARIADLEDGDAHPRDRPPLSGVPVGVKDVFHVPGVPTRAGTDLPVAAFEGPTATAWERLSEAGAVVLGKTVTTEFAYFEPGPTRNPHDASRTPGGSSSGSAAAVAAGACPLALGTQTVGSVIRPAAFCGVVGFKPTQGRIPTDGIVPVSPTLDQVGIFTQDVAGAALAGAVLCEDWTCLPTPAERPTLGVPDEAYLRQADDVGRARFERHVELLATAGFDVRRTDALADVAAVNEHHRTLMAAEMALAHREHGWYPEYTDRYAPVTRDLVEAGDETNVTDLGAARTAREETRSRLSRHMRAAGIDCWVTPAAPGPAPSGLGDTGDPVMNLPWTNAGFPAITLPVETTADDLPLGLQCVAASGCDEDLLGWAAQIAAELGLLTDPSSASP